MNRTLRTFSILALLCIFVLPIAVAPIADVVAQTTTPTTTNPVPVDPEPRPGAFGYVPLTGIPGVTDGDSPSLATYLNALFRIAIGLAALLAVIKITLAGISYMADTGSFSTKEKAKRDITNSLFGLLIILSVVVVLQVINPNILNLNVLSELPPIGEMRPNLPPGREGELLVELYRVQNTDIQNAMNQMCRNESRIPSRPDTCEFMVDLERIPIGDPRRGLITSHCARVAPSGRYLWFEREEHGYRYLACFR